MSARKWRKGEPPHVGWWNASGWRNNSEWRWWNGRTWSSAAYDREPKSTAAAWVRLGLAFGTRYMEWTDYYPANARVPRVAP